MIRHFFSSAFANIVRTPFTTGANILTLALGLACFIAAFGIATYWRSADGYHEKADRTYVIGEGFKEPGAETEGPLDTTVSATVARYLPGDSLEIEHLARAWQQRNVTVGVGDRNTLLNAGFVDPAFLSIFDLKFVAGDPARAFADPNGVILTEAAAARLFGNGPALGQSIRISDTGDAIVTAIIASVRQPSFMGDRQDAILAFDLLAPWPRMLNAARWESDTAWRAKMSYTFVALRPGVTLSAFNDRLKTFIDSRVPPEQRTGVDLYLRAFPLSDLTTTGLDNLLFTQSGASLSAVSVLLSLGALTLIVACINYANLATAQAVGRAKEIGMRRTLGAGRSQIMMQSWLEALLLTALAVCVALAALALAAPAVESLTGVQLFYFFADAERALMVVGGLIVAVAFVAGAYPALALSRVQPAAALASGKSRSAPRFVAHLLVGIQFMSASFLLIVLTVAQLQRSELEKTAIGSMGDPVIVLNGFGPLDIPFETLRARLEANPHIKSVTITERRPFDEGSNLGRFSRSPDAGAIASNARYRFVGDRYFETLDLDLVAGRAFDRNRDVPGAITDAPSREAALIIDEPLAEQMGFASPQAAIDELVYVPGPAGMLAARVIGVTKPEVSALRIVETPFGPVTGSAYAFSYYPGYGYYLPMVRVAPEDVVPAVAAIKATLTELAPNGLADLQFYDDRFREAYGQYARISQLFILLAVTAFFISSVGLLGIAVHVASKRRHEIAIRKTLGSSVAGVVRLLLTDFSVPVLIGNLLAWPLGYFASQAYLAAFANRIDLSPTPFLLSMAITLVIAWAAVIGVVLKAASVRPAEVLRHA